jgi:hypothetical protein
MLVVGNRKVLCHQFANRFVLGINTSEVESLGERVYHLLAMILQATSFLPTNKRVAKEELKGYEQGV